MLTYPDANQIEWANARQPSLAHQHTFIYTHTLTYMKASSAFSCMLLLASDQQAHTSGHNNGTAVTQSVSQSVSKRSSICTYILFIHLLFVIDVLLVASVVVVHNFFPTFTTTIAYLFCRWNNCLFELLLFCLSYTLLFCELVVCFVMALEWVWVLLLYFILILHTI